MGHWNYRVLRQSDESLAIHEVFYGDDGTPRSCTVEPTGFVGDSVEELASSLDLARRALTEGVLDYARFAPSTRDEDPRPEAYAPRRVNAKRAQRVRIATWNLERGGRTKAARRAQDAVLAEHRASIIALTEPPASVRQGPDAVASLPRRVGRDGAESWVAVVGPGVGPLDFPLPYERIAIAARVAVGDARLIVYCSVLPWLAVTSHAPELVRNGEDSFQTFARVLREQAADVVELNRRFGEFVVWAGDFNQSLAGPLTGGSRARRDLLASTLSAIGYLAWNKDAAHAMSGLCAVDLVCGPEQCVPRDQGRIHPAHDGIEISDHAGYWVDLPFQA